ncbi:MAG: nucleotide-binding protein [Anaerolineales bacterium]|nr:nucleotide-binding protein [Anaerolineales bacterium]
MVDVNLVASWIVDCEKVRFVSSEYTKDSMLEKVASLKNLIERINKQKDNLREMGLTIEDFEASGQSFVSSLKEFVDTNGKSEEASTFLIRNQVSLLSILKTWHDQLYTRSTSVGANAYEKIKLTDQAFIVHGHNEALKESVARFIERLGIKAIILHEQPNSGMTIIEKFEAHSSVGFAIILLTADDIGGSVLKKDNLHTRARQNVIFELGYFFGKLGRNRVCAIYEDGVELPSDINGVVYLPLDSAGAWKFRLAKEIKHAGMSVDLNKAV